MRVTPAHVAGWSRVALAVAFLGFGAAWPRERALLAALVVAAGVTDLLDGLLARRFDTVTRMGAVLDYTADKLFFTFALLFFTARGEAPLTLVAIILGRDVLVTGMRLAVLPTGNDFPSRPIGKVRTIATFPVLFILSLGSEHGVLLLSLIAALSAVSLVDYGRVFLGAIRAGDP